MKSYKDLDKEFRHAVISVIIMLIAFIALFIFVCTPGKNRTLEESTDFSTFTCCQLEVVEQRNRSDKLLVDRQTGVLYIYISSAYRGAITPLLNSDGTPKLYNDYYNEVN